MAKKQINFLESLFKVHIEKAGLLEEALPNIAPYFLEAQATFRGMTMFRGDTQDWIVGIRAIDHYGKHVICWGSGRTPLEALMNVDIRVGDQAFKEDKKAPATKGEGGK